MELVVVIATLAILAAMLLPALANTQPKATQAGCLSNQRQMALAWTLYANDNQDALLPYSQGGLTYSGGGYYVATAIPAGTLRQFAQRLKLEQMNNSPLSKYVKDMTVFHCPGDLRFQKLTVGTGWCYESYSKANGMSGNTSASQAVYEKLAQVSPPDQAMVFIEEADPRGYNQGCWYMDNYRWVDPFGIFHGASSTFSFADGHAEAHLWRDNAIIKAATDSANGVYSFYWPGGNKSNPDFVWAWEHFRFANWAPLP